MWVLLACVDYDVKPEDTEPVPEDTGTECPPFDPDCDDTDVDDTAIDTDTDTTGTDACTPAAADAGTVAIDAACEGLPPDPVVDPYALTVEYAYESGGTGAMIKPSVANLDDDDGDGRITSADTPEIVFTLYDENELVVLSGDQTGELLRLPSWLGSGGIVTADVNADGEIDICGFHADRLYRMQCVNVDGDPLWTSTFGVENSWAEITTCDLDADGRPELLGENVVVNGEDGSYAFGLGMTTYTAPVCADIDLDGYQEVLYSDRVYDKDGVLRFSMGAVGLLRWPVPVNTDSDDEAEVFLASDQLSLWESDGTLIYSVPIPTEYPGPPCAADFDGDGAVEIAVPATTALHMFDTDGTLLWSAPISDAGMAGCSSFDLDGDRVPEVLFADEVALHVFDGRTGATLYTSPHSSGTLYEFPVVADVDDDGAAELLVVENYGDTNGLLIYGHDGAGWPAAGEVWHSHDYVLTNIEDDGAVPTDPEPSWLAHNVFRGRPSLTGDMADLSGTILDACVADCVDGPVTLSVQVWNAGALPSRASTWSLYRDDAGILTWLVSGELPALAAGERLASFEVSVALDEFGSNGLVLRLDDDAGDADIRECSEANNELRYMDVLCP